MRDRCCFSYLPRRRQREFPGADRTFPSHNRHPSSGRGSAAGTLTKSHSVPEGRRRRCWRASSAPPSLFSMGAQPPAGGAAGWPSPELPAARRSGYRGLPGSGAEAGAEAWAPPARRLAGRGAPRVGWAQNLPSRRCPLCWNPTGSRRRRRRKKKSGLATAPPPVSVGSVGPFSFLSEWKGKGAGRHRGSCETRAPFALQMWCGEGAGLIVRKHSTKNGIILPVFSCNPPGVGLGWGTSLVTGSSFFLGRCLVEVTPSVKTCTAKISSPTVGVAAKTFSLISFSSRTMHPFYYYYIIKWWACFSQPA